MTADPLNLAAHLTEAERTLLRETCNISQAHELAINVTAVVERILAERATAAEADGPGWFWTQSEWAEWSNELAMLIPEDDVDRYSNPDGAQEAVITDCLRAYVAERERRARPTPRPTCSDPACPIYERHRQQGKTFPPHGQHDFRATTEVRDDEGEQ